MQRNQSCYPLIISMLSSLPSLHPPALSRSAHPELAEGSLSKDSGRTAGIFVMYREKSRQTINSM